jgi:hypothetical protein
MLKFFKRKPKQKDFLIIEIGLEKINCAIFNKEEENIKLSGVGRKKFFSQEEVFDATLEALDALAAIVPKLPDRGVLGISGGSLETTTSIARYTRPHPKKPITKGETEEVLANVVKDFEGSAKKIFFSTIANGNIDGVRVTNPLGLRGEKVELSCFVASKDGAEIDLLDRLTDEIDITVEKIVPTSFVVSKMLERKNLKDAMVIRGGLTKSELTVLVDSHVSEIFPVDLGIQDQEALTLSWQAALKEVKPENAPALVWLFADNDEVPLDSLKETLLSFPWNTKLGYQIAPKIEVAETIHNFSPSDMGIYALSREEVAGEAA